MFALKNEDDYGDAVGNAGVVTGGYGLSDSSFNSAGHGHAHGQFASTPSAASASPPATTVSPAGAASASRMVSQEVVVVADAGDTGGEGTRTHPAPARHGANDLLGDIVQQHAPPPSSSALARRAIVIGSNTTQSCVGITAGGGRVPPTLLGGSTVAGAGLGLPAGGRVSLVSQADGDEEDWRRQDAVAEGIGGEEDEEGEGGEGGEESAATPDWELAPTQQRPQLSAATSQPARASSASDRVSATRASTACMDERSSEDVVAGAPVGEGSDRDGEPRWTWAQLGAQEQDLDLSLGVSDDEDGVGGVVGAEDGGQGKDAAASAGAPSQRVRW